MATTAGGSTYVLSTDLVADYPTASLALANRVDVVASGGPNSIKTSGYTITLADILGGNKFLYNSASPGTFTLPTSGLVDGMTVDVAQIGAGALTVAGGTIVGTTVTTAQYQGLRFVYASTGTTWYSVAPSVPEPGLTLVTPTSIANSGGSASSSNGTVTFTGVTSISLNGIFSSTYNNYQIMVAATGSGTVRANARLRSSGSDNTTSNYYSNFSGLSTWASSVATAGNNSAATSMVLGLVVNASTRSTSNMCVYDPNLAVATRTTELAIDGRVPDGTAYFGGSVFNNTTVFDGMTFSVASGNMTGTIRVYGYKGA